MLHLKVCLMLLSNHFYGLKYLARCISYLQPCADKFCCRPDLLLLDGECSNNDIFLVIIYHVFNEESL